MLPCRHHFSIYGGILEKRRRRTKCFTVNKAAMPVHHARHCHAFYAMLLDSIEEDGQCGEPFSADKLEEEQGVQQERIRQDVPAAEMLRSPQGRESMVPSTSVLGRQPRHGAWPCTLPSTRPACSTQYAAASFPRHKTLLSVMEMEEGAGAGVVMPPFRLR